MDDKKFSVDDILSEVKGFKNKDGDFSDNKDDLLDEILRSSKSFSKIKPDNDEKYQKQSTTSPTAHISSEEVKAQTVADVDKYSNLHFSPHKTSDFSKPNWSVNKFKESVTKVEENLNDIEIDKSRKENTVEIIKELTNSQFSTGDEVDSAIKKENEETKSKFGISNSGYKEFKKKRSDIVDDFILDTMNTDTLQINKENLQPDEQKQDFSKSAGDEKETSNNDFENNEQVSQQLKLMQKRTATKTILSAVLCVLSVLMMLFRPSGESMHFFNVITITPLIYAVMNAALLIITGILSLEIIKGGIIAAIHRQAQKDTMFCLSFVIVAVASVFALVKPGALLGGFCTYLPIYTFCIFFNYLSKYLTCIKTNLNMKFLTNVENKYYVANIEDESISQNFTKGLLLEEPILVKNVKTNSLIDFVFESFKQDRSDFSSQKMLPFVGIAAIAIAFLATYLTKNVMWGIMALNGIFICAISFVSVILEVYPLFKYTKINNKYGAMIAGGDCVDVFGDTNSVLIDSYDLFDNDTVTLYGIKTFSGKRIDDAILDAASVICETKSILTDVFLDMIGNKKELLRTVDSVVYEDLMGMSAWVDDRRVLIGNRELMLNHGIDVPSKDYEERFLPKVSDDNEVIYLSSSGQLTAAFAVGLKVRSVNKNLIRLVQKNKIGIVLKTVDPVLTKEKLARLFNVDEELFKVLPSRLHKDYASQMNATKTAPASIANNGKVFGYLISILSAKKIKSVVNVGVVLQACLIVLAVFLYAIFAFLGSLAQLGNIEILVYMAVWLFVYFLIQKVIRL